MDQITYDAPYFLIAMSAGNDRNHDPTGANGYYYVLNGQWTWSTNFQGKEKDGGIDGYECIPPAQTAKNILTVGAVLDIPNGYQNDEDDVVMTQFSSWGPTDDGRIKPDIVANGLDLLSLAYFDNNNNPSNNSYYTISGTSMATPNMTGSVALLIEHYQNTHGLAMMKASTMKALVIHTADEAGISVGPTINLDGVY